MNNLEMQHLLGPSQTELSSDNNEMLMTLGDSPPSLEDYLPPPAPIHLKL